MRLSDFPLASELHQQNEKQNQRNAKPMGYFTIHITQQGKMLASVLQFECSLLSTTKELKKAFGF